MNVALALQKILGFTSITDVNPNAIRVMPTIIDRDAYMKQDITEVSNKNDAKVIYIKSFM